MNKIPLGKNIEIKSKYDPTILFSIPRIEQRNKNQINNNFNGYDIWNIYELSWLNIKGKPETKLAKIIYPSNTDYIIESKSLKLYINSFSMSNFNTKEEVINIIKRDIGKLLNTNNITVLLFNYNYKIKYSKIPKKLLLDNLDINIDSYHLNSSLLIKKKGKNKIKEIYSNLLKTNCPITNQPDWATINILYKSNYFIEDSSLLKYIISYRNHKDFHESTCEKIFNDLFKLLEPTILVVKCFYTRRGGIDINPIRFFGNTIKMDYNYHYWRQ